MKGKWLVLVCCHVLEEMKLLNPLIKGHSEHLARISEHHSGQSIEKGMEI